MEKALQAKWEGKVSAKLSNATVDQIWPLFTDFFNFQKWFPSLSTCHGVHGTNGDPGCIRYCSGFSIPSNGGDKPVSWSKERLVAVDHAQHSLSYEIVDSNIGFESYVSTVKIVPGSDPGDDHDHQRGCVIEWSFTVDPVEGWALDDLVRKYEVGLQQMAQKMEASFGNRKQAQAKWEGKVSARLVKSSVNQIWPLFTDFFNIHKWFPGMETCYAVHGNNGEPGCIRYCSSGSIKTSSNDVVSGEKYKPPSWGKERLIAVDHDEHTLIYELLENNIGFESYVATVKIVPGGDEDSPRGCVIEWSFAVDPIEGWALDDMERQYDEWLHHIADKMESSLVNLE